MYMEVNTWLYQATPTLLTRSSSGTNHHITARLRLFNLAFRVRTIVDLQVHMVWWTNLDTLLELRTSAKQLFGTSRFSTEYAERKVCKQFIICACLQHGLRVWLQHAGLSDLILYLSLKTASPKTTSLVSGLGSLKSTKLIFSSGCSILQQQRCSWF